MRVLTGPVRVIERPGGVRRLVTRDPLGAEIAIDLAAEAARVLRAELAPPKPKRKSKSRK